MTELILVCLVFFLFGYLSSSVERYCLKSQIKDLKKRLGDNK